MARRFAADYPQHGAAIVEAADAVPATNSICSARVRALGTTLPWHTDFKTGREWPLTYCADIEYNELDRPTDVKVPWELSRCQHFTRLGQAYWLTGDERYAEEFVAETTDWIDGQPVVLGVNWACAMDVALRAVSWIWGFHFFADSRGLPRRAFRSRFLRALFMHGEFIVKHLEKADLNGNHYLCDGVGLVFLGCFFRRARCRPRAGLRSGAPSSKQEMFEQTTADGVDFEQSTAYHRLVLEAFLTSYLLLRRHGEDAAAPLLDAARAHVRVRRRRTPSRTAVRRSSAMRTTAACRCWARSDRATTGICCRTPRCCSIAADFKTAAGRCWEETFWLLGPGARRAFRAAAGSRALPAVDGVSATAASTCCAAASRTSDRRLR